MALIMLPRLFTAFFRRRALVRRRADRLIALHGEESWFVTRSRALAMVPNSDRSVFAWHVVTRIESRLRIDRHPDTAPATMRGSGPARRSRWRSRPMCTCRGVQRRMRDQSRPRAGHDRTKSSAPPAPHRQAVTAPRRISPDLRPSLRRGGTILRHRDYHRAGRGRRRRRSEDGSHGNPSPRHRCP